jgi:hypothetical protein
LDPRVGLIEKTLLASRCQVHFRNYKLRQTYPVTIRAQAFPQVRELSSSAYRAMGIPLFLPYTQVSGLIKPPGAAVVRDRIELSILRSGP